MPADAPSELFARAKAARQQGRAAEAAALLEDCVKAEPGFAPAWNMLGILQLEAGQPAEAARSLERAVTADPGPPFGWFNLARTQRAVGDRLAELKSLDQALTRDPYFLPALLAKGETLCALDRPDDAAALYRLLFEGLGEVAALPEPIQQQLAQARAILEARGSQQWEVFAGELEGVAARFPDSDLARVRGFAENLAGRRKVYQQQPTGGHFPYLPAIEFFDPALFPWFEQLEAATGVIRDELIALWANDDPNFRPYVAKPAGEPLNQWQELNHSPRWSAFFFWEDGRRNDANCARCPRTAEIIEALPMLDIPGKGPTAMFSVLKPHTRLPAHTGTTNVRTTIHLGLVIPPGCGFRVGSETRQWREGECWAFDDTIEHEAWNDSDQTRAILIIDGWNPLLSEAEREAVRALEPKT